METLKAIFSRTSIRRYTGEAVPEETVKTILHAGMSAPSCVGARDWEFITVTDPEVLNKMADANGRPAEPLRGAAFAVLVCGDLDRAFKGAPDYWIVDGAAVCENMIIAATDLGIGSVWLGTYPQMNRVENLKKLFELPDNIVPHSIISFGFPAEETGKEYDRYEPEKVHFNKW